MEKIALLFILIIIVAIIIAIVIIARRNPKKFYGGTPWFKRITALLGIATSNVSDVNRTNTNDLVNFSDDNPLRDISSASALDVGPADASASGSVVTDFDNSDFNFANNSTYMTNTNTDNNVRGIITAKPIDDTNNGLTAIKQTGKQRKEFFEKLSLRKANKLATNIEEGRRDLEKKLKELKNALRQQQNDKKYSDKYEYIRTGISAIAGAATIAIATVAEGNKKLNDIIGRYRDNMKRLDDCRTENANLGAENKELRGQIEAQTGLTTRQGQTLTETVAEKQRLATDNQELIEQNQRLTADNQGLTADNQRLTTKNQGLNDQIQNLTTKNNELEEQIQRLETENIKLTEKNIELSGQNTMLKVALGRKDNEIEGLKKEVAILKQNVEDRNKLISAKDKLIDECNNKNTTNGERIDKVNKQITDAINNLTDKEKQFSDMENRLNDRLTDMTKTNDELREEINRMQNEIQKINNDKNSLTAENKNLNEINNNLNRINTKNTDKIRQLEEEIGRLSRENQKAINDLKTQMARMSDIHDKIIREVNNRHAAAVRDIQDKCRNNINKLNGKVGIISQQLQSEKEITAGLRQQLDVLNEEYNGILSQLQSKCEQLQRDCDQRILDCNEANSSLKSELQQQSAVASGIIQQLEEARRQTEEARRQAEETRRQQAQQLEEARRQQAQQLEEARRQAEEIRQQADQQLEEVRNNIPPPVEYGYIVKPEQNKSTIINIEDIKAGNYLPKSTKNNKYYITTRNDIPLSENDKKRLILSFLAANKSLKVNGMPIPNTMEPTPEAWVYKGDRFFTYVKGVKN
jgi:chromosome segregation ATPase